jgi:hypothetical protein
MGKWKQRHNDELHNFYRPPGIMLVTPTTRWAGHIALMVEMRKACRIMVAISEGPSLGRPRCIHVHSKRDKQGAEWFQLALNMAQ